LIAAGLLFSYLFTRLINVHGTSEFDFLIFIAGIFGVLAVLAFARERKSPSSDENGDLKK